jgi:hypothetical protein
VTTSDGNPKYSKSQYRGTEKVSQERLNEKKHFPLDVRLRSGPFVVAMRLDGSAEQYGPGLVC